MLLNTEVEFFSPVSSDVLEHIKNGGKSVEFRLPEEGTPTSKGTAVWKGFPDRVKTVRRNYSHGKLYVYLEGGVIGWAPDEDVQHLVIEINKERQPEEKITLAEWKECVKLATKIRESGRTFKRLPFPPEKAGGGGAGAAAGAAGGASAPPPIPSPVVGGGAAGVSSGDLGSSDEKVFEWAVFRPWVPVQETLRHWGACGGRVHSDDFGRFP